MRGLALVALVSCKDARAPRGDEAPAAAARLLRYQPANVSEYKVAVTGGTALGALVPFDVSRTLAVDVVPDGDRWFHVVVSDETDPNAAFPDTSALLLFPELPAEPIAPGRRWTVTHAVVAHGMRVDLSHEIVYKGDETCPSGARHCSQLALAAPARNLIVGGGSAAWIVTYGFTGTIAIDRERGIIDESRLRIIGSVAMPPANIPVDVTVVATPARANNDAARD